MSDTIIAALIVSILGPLVGIIGILTTYYCIDKTNIKNKNREIKINYLIDTFRKAASAIHRDPMPAADKRKFEELVEDIQFLGTPLQIESISKFLEDYQKSNNQGDLEGLLNNIRVDIRKELMLDETKQKMRWFRFKN